VKRTVWEYLVLEQSAHKTWIADDYGAEGWELVGVVRATALVDRLWFKRPIKTLRKRTPHDQHTKKEHGT
jgi:hypothetical protein